MNVPCFVAGFVGSTDGANEGEGVDRSIVGSRDGEEVGAIVGIFCISNSLTFISPVVKDHLFNHQV